jgi:glycerol-3-phosphate dehydrogenase
MSDLSERAFMMQSAPFMSRPLPMMIPLTHWWEVPVYWVSAKMYDFLAGSRSAVPESHLISKVPPAPKSIGWCALHPPCMHHVG